MQDGVPVAELVAGVEAGDPQRGGVGDGARRPRPRRAPSRSAASSASTIACGSSPSSARTSASRPRQPPSGRPPSSAVGQLGEGPLQERDQVDRVAPGVRLLHARRRWRRTGARLVRTASACSQPTRSSGLERLVDEVERVAAVEVAVVGAAAKSMSASSAGVGAGARSRSDERALGPSRVAHLDELAEPGVERGPVGTSAVGSGSSGEARRLPVAVARDWTRPW